MPPPDTRPSLLDRAGNISQLLKHADAFGLDTDRKRVVRLFFQPVLVVWALFAGGVI